jgi:hypothetical protein
MLKYSKIDLCNEDDFIAVEKFVESEGNVNVYLSDLNPVTNSKADKELKYENVELYLYGRELHFDDRRLSLRIEGSKETQVYLGTNDMLITMPRGYKGASTYFHFVKVNK